MSTIDALIDKQLRRWEFERTHGHRSGLVEAPASVPRSLITVCRQHGTNGVAIAERLADRLHYTLLHRDVIDRMCESSGITRRLLEALEEQSRSQLTMWFESMLAGAYVDASDYTRALLQVIYSIAELGGVVVVGRGANFILGMERGFHVRVVAPRPARIRAIMARKRISERDARREVDGYDHDRGEFTRRMFGRSVEDPLGYDVMLHSLDLSPDGTAAWLAEAARGKFARLASLPGEVGRHAFAGTRPGMANGARAHHAD